jgi:hypothetical protein
MNPATRSRETRSIRLGSGADEQTAGMRSRIHPLYKTKYGVANWPSYDRALVRRGDVTLWLSREAAGRSSISASIGQATSLPCLDRRDG